MLRAITTLRAVTHWCVLVVTISCYSGTTQRQSKCSLLKENSRGSSRAACSNPFRSHSRVPHRIIWLLLPSLILRAIKEICCSSHMIKMNLSMRRTSTRLKKYASSSRLLLTASSLNFRPISTLQANHTTDNTVYTSTITLTTRSLRSKQHRDLSMTSNGIAKDSTTWWSAVLCLHSQFSSPRTTLLPLSLKNSIRIRWFGATWVVLYALLALATLMEKWRSGICKQDNEWVYVSLTLLHTVSGLLMTANFSPPSLHLAFVLTIATKFSPILVSSCTRLTTTIPSYTKQSG